MALQLLQETVEPSFSLTESKQGLLLVSGEFARCGVATENKRVYPSPLWEREINRLRPGFADRKVYGEVDHPCFTSDNFRVFTPSGWKAFRDVKVGDRVWSRQGGKAVLSSVEGITDEPYKGAAYHVKGRSIDSGFTPNHRLLLLKRPGRYGGSKEEMVSLRDIVANRGRYAHHAIPKTAEFFSESPSEVVIPGVQGVRRFGDKDYTQPIRLEASLYAAFMGLYLSEGHCVEDGRGAHRVVISQKTEWSRERIWEDVLSKFPAELRWVPDKTGFGLADARMCAHLKKLGDVYSKFVPEDVKRLSASDLREFLFWFAVGDGRMVASQSVVTDRVPEGESVKQSLYAEFREGSVKNTRTDVFSVSERLVRDLHECLVRAGGSGTFSRVIQEGGREIEGRVIKEESRSDLFQLHFNASENIWLDPRSLCIEEFQHTGNVYCLTVANGNFYAEQNGRSFWTGNSDGKTKLSRASHIVTDLRIEDGVVVGTAEILPTSSGKDLSALLKSGCKVGISSRGYGTTQPNTKGEDVVQEDYRLVTFDFVADPADSTAYPSIVSEDKDDQGRFLFEGVAFDIPQEVEDLLEAQAQSSTEELKDQLSAEVLARLSEMREGIETQIREEIEGNSDLVQKAQLVDSFVASVKAFAPSKDGSEDSEKEENEHLLALQTELEIAKERIADLEEENAELESTAKNIGFRYYLDRALESNPDRERILRLVGDVTEYKDATTLKARVEEVQSELRALRETREREAQALTEVRNIEDQQRRELYERAQKSARKERARGKKLEEALKRSLEALEQVKLEKYASKRLAINPHRDQIQTILEGSEIDSEEGVDDLIDSFRPKKLSVEAIERTSARVRRRMGGGYRGTPLDEEEPWHGNGQEQRSQPEQQQRQLAEDTQGFNGLGITLGDLQDRMPPGSHRH